MPTTYTYTISTDFPNGAVDRDNLVDEIQAENSILVSLNNVDLYPNGDLDRVDIIFNANLDSGSKTALDGDTSGPAGGLISNHDHEKGTSVDQVQLTNIGTSSSNHLKVEVEPREGVGKNFYSPNMCDRTTWYENSTLVSEFSLTDSGDQTTWNTNGTHPGPWIDLVHGKIFSEDLITAENSNYLCVVEVSTDGGSNWTTKTENTFNDLDGDYSVNYSSGEIIFNTALGGSDQVRASFSKAPSTLQFTIAPESGKKIRLVHVECQISVDVGFTSNIEYQVWAYNPLDLPNKFKVKANVYKTVLDFLYESTGVFPTFPKLDVNGPRGIPQDIVVVPFDYTASREIKSSQGAEIRMVQNKEFTGAVCNATFYCLIEDE